MPSGLTHILLTKMLQNNLPDGDLKNIIAYGSDSLIIGAVAPDVPYASLVDDALFHDEVFLADDFHYMNTNQMPLQSLVLLKNIKNKVSDDVHYRIFSFYLGYISHVFADGIIHPFVRDKVGDYAMNKTGHRELEMQLDVLLLNYVTKSSGIYFELNFANMHKELQNFSQIEGVAHIIDTFSSLIQLVYNKKISQKQILGWIDGLYRLFDVAEGDYPVFITRLKCNTILYKRYNDIDAEKVLNLKKPVDRERNFINAETINFIDHCLPQFFLKYITVAQRAYEFVYNDGCSLNDKDIPNINLDTGRLVENNDLNEVPILWINN